MYPYVTQFITFISAYTEQEEFLYFPWEILFADSVLTRGNIEDAVTAGPTIRHSGTLHNVASRLIHIVKLYCGRCGKAHCIVATRIPTDIISTHLKSDYSATFDVLNRQSNQG